VEEVPRFGIFSDVHANIEAMTAVARVLEGEQIDEYICLGDVVGYGGSPEETCNIVRGLAKHTILGNHDAAVAGRMDYSFYYEAARHALDLHAKEISPANMEWLRTLPYEVRAPEHRVTFCHGSPLNLEDFEYIFAPEQAQLCFSIWDNLAPLTLIGHSHLCKAFALAGDTRDPSAVGAGAGEVFEVVANEFELRDGYKYIISVGSVGQPRDYDNRASYVIYDSDRRRFEFRRVEYDIERAAKKIFESSLERNFGNRLFIGV
jgi:diadenosine tetraphosphatase ApaH/serine/threonine PP2A family protein phosphatase